jgi:hypothetical protein
MNFATVVKWWTKEREVCQKMEQKITKWRNGYPCLRQLCSTDHFRNGCGRSKSHKTDFRKPTIQNSGFVHSHGDVTQKRRHLCPRRSESHNSIFTLCIGLVPSQLHTTLLMKNWISQYFCVPDYRYHAAWRKRTKSRFWNYSFKSVTASRGGTEWSTEPHVLNIRYLYMESVPSDDQNISS